METFQRMNQVKIKDNHGNTALMEAAGRGATEIVKALIKAGAEANVNDEDGWTALMRAADDGHTETVNALIKAGAEVNAKDNDGWTALMRVADDGHTETVNILIKAGAEVNAKDNDGWTAFMFAENAESVNALIETGADDLTDNEGKTALIHAASSDDSNPETVNALIDAGLYVKQRDNSGKTALDYARKYSHHNRDIIKRPLSNSHDNAQKFIPLPCFRRGLSSKLCMTFLPYATLGNLSCMPVAYRLCPLLRCLRYRYPHYLACTLIAP